MTEKNIDHVVESNSSPRRVLTLLDCICIIVGTIIGAGIFVMPAVVSTHVPDVQWFFAVWVFGGAIALIGAICFAELTTTYPDRGGDYGYLKRGYNKQVGFAFSWAAFWVIRPGNIGAMAIIFGKFASQAFPWMATPLWLAIYSVVVMTATNLLGVTFGKTVQNFLTIAKVTGILLVLSAALMYGLGGDGAVESVANVAISTVESDSAQTSFWLAMVFVMFTFGGWNDIAFVASEVQQPEKNLLRSLILGTSVVLVIYLLVNLALVVGLGFPEMSRLGSKWENPTSALIETRLGPQGLAMFAVLVCLSCLGAINAMIFTSPRIYWATALDYPSLRWLAGSFESRRGWWRAMLLQGAVTIVFVAVFGRQEQGIDNIVAATAPYFWLFLSLTVISLMICRVRYRGQFTGFRTPLYPLLPLIFVTACGLMMVQAWSYLWEQKLWLPAFLIGGWVLIGVVFSLVLEKRKLIIENR